MSGPGSLPILCGCSPSGQSLSRAETGGLMEPTNGSARTDRYLRDEMRGMSCSEHAIGLAARSKKRGKMPWMVKHNPGDPSLRVGGRTLRDRGLNHQVRVTKLPSKSTISSPAPPATGDELVPEGVVLHTPR